jgi:PAS domain S-box-containing protein
LLGNVPALRPEQALDALDVGIIVLDGDGTIVGWNDWIAGTTGVDRQSAIGRALLSIFPDLQQTRLPTAISDAVHFGSSSILTHTLNRLLPLRGADGSTLLHNIVVRPVTTGASAFCLLQVTDVTIAVTRERVLRERQNARYRAIVDSARDAIITIDTEARINWVNEAADAAFGYTSSELLGKSIDVLLDPVEDVGERIRIQLIDGSAGVVQVSGRRKSGDLAHFAVSVGRWKADEREFATTIWRDITERLVAEAAIRESESRYRALLEALPQLVWTCAPDGNCDYVNPQWQEYTGATADQHRGWAWLDVVHADDRVELQAVWNDALSSGSTFDADARLVRSDGSKRWFKLRSIPVRAAGGTITRWLGTATDITDLMEARDTLRRTNDELEAEVVARTREREVVLRQLHESQKMESIGQLTGGVAHDFNNLLAVILSSLSLLKKNLPNDPQTSRYIEGAMQGAERGAALTKRLLAFARRQELKLEATDINKLISGLMDFLRRTVGPSISITADISHDVHPVKVDANQFELALMNLAVNARDAMHNGGVLTIAAQDEDVGTRHGAIGLKPGKYVRISVTDTGTGMSEATLAKAMEPFFTTKGVGKGTGLGLSMVHGLTTQSGGAMNIVSELGKGTSVSIWLPRARREDLLQVARQSEPASSKTGHKLRVLLVDDDALVSVNTGYMLTDMGHSVSEAHTAVDALDLLKAPNHGFDIVITDYAMPNMNGLDLAHQIRKLHPGLPVIMASGYAELPPDVLLGFPRLNKPYTEQQLSIALELASRKNGEC